MKLKLSQLVNAQNALSTLAIQRVVASTSFRIARNLKVVASEMELYEAQRKALLDKYGVLSADKTRYQFENGNGEKFNEEFRALLDTEIDTSITPILMDDLGDVKMTPGEMLVLEWMFVAEVDTAKDVTPNG